MPTKPLPKSLVARLRCAIKKNEKKKIHGKHWPALKRMYRALGRLKNIDHRQNENERRASPANTRHWGGRVRQMDVSRNYPDTELVLKRTHGASARSTLRQIRWRVLADSMREKTIQALNRLVKTHNRLFRPRDYELRMPIAYPVGKNILAMSKTPLITVGEIVGLTNDPFDLVGHTERGEHYFEKLEKQHGVTRYQLRQACTQVYERTGIHHNNLLLDGVKNKKFVFVPLLDKF